MIVRFFLAITLFLNFAIRATSAETDFFAKLESHVEFLEGIPKKLELDQAPLDEERSAYLTALYDYLRLTYLVSDWLKDDMEDYSLASKRWREANQFAKTNNGDERRRRAQQLIELSAKIDRIGKDIDLKKQERRELRLKTDSLERLCAMFGLETCASNGTAQQLNDARTKIVETETMIAGMELDIRDAEKVAAEITRSIDDPTSIKRQAIGVYNWTANPFPPERLERFPLSDDATLEQWMANATAFIDRMKFARESILKLMQARHEWKNPYLDHAKKRAMTAYGVNPYDPSFAPTKIVDTVAEYGVERRASDGTIVYEARCELSSPSKTEIISSTHGRIFERCSDHDEWVITEDLIPMMTSGEYANEWAIDGGCPTASGSDSCPMFQIPCFEMPCTYKLDELNTRMQTVQRLDPFKTQP